MAYVPPHRRAAVPAAAPAVPLRLHDLPPLIRRHALAQPRLLDPRASLHVPGCKCGGGGRGAPSDDFRIALERATRWDDAGRQQQLADWPAGVSAGASGVCVRLSRRFSAHEWRDAEAEVLAAWTDACGGAGEPPLELRVRACGLAGAERNNGVLLVVGDRGALRAEVEARNARNEAAVAQHGRPLFRDSVRRVVALPLEDVAACIRAQGGDVADPHPLLLGAAAHLACRAARTHSHLLEAFAKDAPRSWAPLAAARLCGRPGLDAADALAALAAAGTELLALVHQYRNEREPLKVSLPGGKRWLAEDAHASALREAAEETGGDAAFFAALEHVAVVPRPACAIVVKALVGDAAAVAQLEGGMARLAVAAPGSGAEVQGASL